MSFRMMFQILHEHGLARTGRLSTNRGSINTPALLLSIRNGDLHGLTPDTYNCFLRNTGILLNPLDYEGVKFKPQQNAVKAMNFSNAPFVLCFPRDPVQTEYLPSNNDKGVVVALRPGQKQISPSFYTDLVKKLHPDVCAALWDQVVVSKDANEKRLITAVYRSSKWLEKTMQGIKSSSEIWATISYGKLKYLNKLATEKLSMFDTSGYILDRFPVEDETTDSFEDLKYVISCLDNKQPKMLPGKISPIKMLEAIEQGVDLFDSSLIWDLSLRSQALVWVTSSSSTRSIPSYTILDLNNDSYKTDASPLMECCECYCCIHHCRGYIHHLLQEKEIIGQVLLQIHNVHWMLDFFQIIRDSINADKLLQLKEE
eukprot:g3922.t1